MKILASIRRNFHLVPGDIFTLKYNNQEVLSHPITTAMRVDIAHVIEFEKGDLGLEFGIGGVFGKEQKQHD